MFKIYGTDGTGRKPVFLKLRKTGTEEVDVIAVDENGKEVVSGNLVRFTKEGILMRHGGVSSTIGIQLDHDSKIVMSKY